MRTRPLECPLGRQIWPLVRFEDQPAQLRRNHPYAHPGAFGGLAS